MSKKTVFTLILVAAFSLGPVASATTPSVTGDGPKIENPEIAPGTLAKDAKGFVAKSVAAEAKKPGSSAMAAEEMGRRAVSDRCFVTTVDYCYMDSYAPLGAPCICSDGYYYYNGVVY
jgi:hypothetical protein